MEKEAGLLPISGCVSETQQEGVCPWKKDNESLPKCFWNPCHVPGTVLEEELNSQRDEGVPCPHVADLLAILKLAKLNTMNLVVAAKYKTN